MHWVKKTVFGMFFAVFLFIAVNIFFPASTGLFATEFLGISGLAVLLVLGFTETNLVTYG